MRLLKYRDITVVRANAATTYVKGRKQAVSYTTFTIKAHIQSISLTTSGGETRTQQEQGNILSLQYNIYSSEELKIADKITDINGESYIVKKVYDWTHINLATKHFKSVADREEI